MSFLWAPLALPGAHTESETPGAPDRRRSLHDGVPPLPSPLAGRSEEDRLYLATGAPAACRALGRPLGLVCRGRLLPPATRARRRTHGDVAATHPLDPLPVCAHGITQPGAPLRSPLGFQQRARPTPNPTQPRKPRDRPPASPCVRRRSSRSGWCLNGRRCVARTACACRPRRPVSSRRTPVWRPYAATNPRTRSRRPAPFSGSRRYITPAPTQGHSAAIASSSASPSFPWALIDGSHGRMWSDRSVRPCLPTCGLDVHFVNPSPVFLLDEAEKCRHLWAILRAVLPDPTQGLRLCQLRTLPPSL